MKELIYTQRVAFGDCDPARIVWFPNFFRWIDSASRHFFVECSVPPWHETEKKLGIIGTPLVDTPREVHEDRQLAVTSCRSTPSIPEWRNKSFAIA